MCQPYNVLREKRKIWSLAAGKLTKVARSWLVKIGSPQLSIFWLTHAIYRDLFLKSAWSKYSGSQFSPGCRLKKSILFHFSEVYSYVTDKNIFYSASASGLPIGVVPGVIVALDTCVWFSVSSSDSFESIVHSFIEIWKLTIRYQGFFFNRLPFIRTY